MTDLTLFVHFQQQRRLDLLTITHPENLYPPEGQKQKMVFITSRVHPGETPSSFVCQGRSVNPATSWILVLD
jgi:hypothetical protein